MRIVVDALFGRRECRRRAAARSRCSRAALRRQAAMANQDLDDLLADRDRTGLSDVIGSWKIIARRSPRRSRIARSGSSRVAAVERTLPRDLGGCFRQQPHDGKAVTLLPQPLSPTIPSVAPRASSKLTVIDRMVVRPRRRGRRPLGPTTATSGVISVLGGAHPRFPASMTAIGDADRIAPAGRKPGMTSIARGLRVRAVRARPADRRDRRRADRDPATLPRHR